MESPLQTIERLQKQVSDLEAQLAAVQQGVQPPFMYAIADGYGQPFFEEQGCVSSEAKDLQPEVDSLNQNLDGEPPYAVVPVYTHPAAPQAVQAAEGVPAQFGTGVAACIDKLNWLQQEHPWNLKQSEALSEAITALESIAATHPTQQGLDALTQAARSVLAERARQIAAEGYTPEQDDGYNPGVLALHGGLYACHAYDTLAKKRAPEGWQWDAKWWKSKDPRSNLVKAGALVLAEIERMDRSFAAQAKQGEQA